MVVIDCTPQPKGAVAWNDPDLRVDLPCATPILSPRDRAAPSPREYVQHLAFTFR